MFWSKSVWYLVGEELKLYKKTNMRNFREMQRKIAQPVQWKEYYKLQYDRI